MHSAAELCAVETYYGTVSGAEFPLIKSSTWSALVFGLQTMWCGLTDIYSAQIWSILELNGWYPYVQEAVLISTDPMSHPRDPKT